MPRVFLIKKKFGGGNSITKPKRVQDESPNQTLKNQDDLNDQHLTIYNTPQHLTPPNIPSTDSIETPPPPDSTLIPSCTELQSNQLLSPSLSEPINVKPSKESWSKPRVLSYLSFNFTSFYPHNFPQLPNINPDLYPHLYQIFSEPIEPLYTRFLSPIKRSEPLTSPLIDINSSNLYRSWCAKQDSQPRSSPSTPNSDIGSETAVDTKKPKSTCEVPRYQCSNCIKNYTTMSGWTKHQQFHCMTQTKSFGCKNCDKIYVSLGALKMHIKTHTLPCKCMLCGKAFSRPWLLQGHLRTHTGEKPFVCQHCKRAFADRSNLRAHLQTHSDTKKYSCKNCSKTFTRMSFLLKHEDEGCPGIKDIDGG